MIRAELPSKFELSMFTVPMLTGVSTVEMTVNVGLAAGLFLVLK